MDQEYKNYKYVLILPLIVVLLDQLTKFLVTSYMQLNQSIPIINNIFHLTYITNTGTLFGSFKDNNMLFIWLSLIIIGALLYLYDKFDKTEQILFSLVIGAAIGNLIDRVVYGYVIDFLDFRIWPVFNIADSVISVSTIVLLIYLLKRDFFNKHQ
ncbi:signal peptidase II [Candidatus Woesearchaeota archaeon]|nr:signal peptidase II [Candidatus Woesearchaeota archaeon]